LQLLWADGAASAHTATAASQEHWYGTWRAAPQQPAASGTSRDGLDNETVRMVIHATVGGSSARVRLSNAYGTQPVVIGKTAVALHEAGPTVDAGTEHVVTFNGQGVVTFNGQGSVTNPGWPGGRQRSRADARPLRLNPIYDTGGGRLHPNDLGYKAMADAIDLALLSTSSDQH
jgi:hypothetical protein